MAATLSTTPPLPTGDVLLRQDPLSGDGRQPLIVCLDRDTDDRLELAASPSRGAPRTLGPVQRERQANHDSGGPDISHDLGHAPWSFSR